MGWIKKRILEEHKKHERSGLDWALLAEHKIVSELADKNLKTRFPNQSPQDIPDDLKTWMSDITVSEIHDVLEFLEDHECLNNRGKKVSSQFWEKYIKYK